MKTIKLLEGGKYAGVYTVPERKIKKERCNVINDPIRGYPQGYPGEVFTDYQLSDNLIARTISYPSGRIDQEVILYSSRGYGYSKNWKFTIE